MGRLSMMEKILVPRVFQAREFHMGTEQIRIITESKNLAPERLS
jgi:hypothetical protein